MGAPILAAEFLMNTRDVSQHMGTNVWQAIKRNTVTVSNPHSFFTTASNNDSVHSSKLKHSPKSRKSKIKSIY